MQTAPVGCFAERNRAGSELGVEPAPGLVLSFGDEVCGPEVIELCGFTRESERSPRCNGRVEPDIEDILDPFHRAAAAARDRDIIHVGAVWIRKRPAAAFFEFADGAYHPISIAFRADPDRDRYAPVALARDAPVAGFLDPVVEPCASRPIRVPGDLCHFLEHQVPHLGDF